VVGSPQGKERGRKLLKGVDKEAPLGTHPINSVEHGKATPNQVPTAHLGLRGRKSFREKPDGEPGRHLRRELLAGREGEKSDKDTGPTMKRRLVTNNSKKRKVGWPRAGI